MNLGEIKIEALRLMFVTQGEDFDPDRLSDLRGDELYGSYLIAMPGSINRCFADLETRGVLPVKSFSLCANDKVGSLQRFNLPELIGDYFCAERLVYESGGEVSVDESFSFQTEGDVLYLPWFDNATEQYRLLYRPKLARIGAGTAEDTELPLPEHIAAAIPYWIKGELFREDEPNEAAEARNWYEAAMSGAQVRVSRREGRVRDVYSMTEV